MILIGTMNLTRTRERGDFFCPSCDANQSYRLRARRPWLTLYFIPTVPVGGAELFVECDQCRQSWDPTVLAMDREAHEQAREEEFRDEAVKAAVLVVIADGTITENEIEALKRVASRLLERDVERDELGRLCSIAQQNKIEASNYVLTVSRRWNQQQRIQALQAMFLAATADGEMAAPQVKTLSVMKELLELTEEQYQGAIEEALEWESV